MLLLFIFFKSKLQYFLHCNGVDSRTWQCIWNRIFSDMLHIKITNDQSNCCVSIVFFTWDQTLPVCEIKLSIPDSDNHWLGHWTTKIMYDHILYTYYFVPSPVESKCIWNFSFLSRVILLVNWAGDKSATQREKETFRFSLLYSLTLSSVAWFVLYKFKKLLKMIWWRVTL